MVVFLVVVWEEKGELIGRYIEEGILRMMLLYLDEKNLFIVEETAAVVVQK